MYVYLPRPLKAFAHHNRRTVKKCFFPPFMCVCKYRLVFFNSE